MRSDGETTAEVNIWKTGPSVVQWPHVEFEFALRRPVGAKPGLRRNGLGKSGRRVAVEQRALPQLEIEIMIAVDVPEIRSAAPGERERED